jgi:hypothetical protein
MPSQNSGDNDGVNHGAIQNLKPWPKGISGNPGGAPKVKHIRAMLEKVLLAPVPENGEVKLRLERLGDKLITRIEAALDNPKITPQGIQQIGDTLEKLFTRLDGAELAKEAAREDRVTLSSGKVVREETVLTLKQPVDVTDSQAERTR